MLVALTLMNVRVHIHSPVDPTLGVITLTAAMLVSAIMVMKETLILAALITMSVVNCLLCAWIRQGSVSTLKQHILA